MILALIYFKTQHWRDSEVGELLLIRGGEEIRRQVTGTVRDTKIYNNIFLLSMFKQHSNMIQSALSLKVTQVKLILI